MDSLLADDFIITVEDGTTFSKAGYIAHNGDSTVHLKKSEMSDLRVRMHGSTAVVTGAYYEKGTTKGKPHRQASNCLGRQARNLADQLRIVGVMATYHQMSRCSRLQVANGSRS